MLRIVCVNSGNYCGIGKQYVEILYDMVRRNLSLEVQGEFICFTNDTEPYAEGIIKRPLHGGLKGWYNKIYLFKDGLFDAGDRIIYFDLDTVIVGGLDNLIKYDGDFAILRDVYRPQGYQSSVMAWKAGEVGYIWANYQWEGFPETVGGDQAFIEKRCPHPDIIQDIFPNQFKSYKQECQWDIPPHTRVVFFHGHPRPHECQGNWVEQVTANVKYAATLPLETLTNVYMKPHEQSLAIIGGGPSLKLDIEEIRQKQQEGTIIWALNNTFSYLIEREIYPDAHILLDAREENVAFVPEKTNATMLYAYQCHPKVLNKGVEAGHVILWCPSLPGMLECLQENNIKAALIGVGCSVGMKALGLAFLFGFKNVHLYGYDSSYKNGRNHAYQQKLNDGERIIEVVCNGKRFSCAPWMAKQVQEFRENISDFVKKGMVFTVHGSGLLPYMASLMEMPND